MAASPPRTSSSISSSSPPSSPKVFVTAPSSPAVSPAAAVHNVASPIFQSSPLPSAASVVLAENANIEATIQAAIDKKNKDIIRQELEKIKRHLNLQVPLHKIYEAKCNLEIARHPSRSNHNNPDLLNDTLVALEQAQAMIGKAESSLQPDLNHQLLNVWNQVVKLAQGRPLFASKVIDIQTKIKALRNSLAASSLSSTSLASRATVSPSLFVSSASSSATASTSTSDEQTERKLEKDVHQETLSKTQQHQQKTEKFMVDKPPESTSPAAAASVPPIAISPPTETVQNKSQASDFLSLREGWLLDEKDDIEKIISSMFQVLSDNKIIDAKIKFLVMSWNIKLNEPIARINYALCVLGKLFCSSSFEESKLKQDVHSALEQLERAEKLLPTQASSMQKLAYQRMELLYRKMSSFLKENHLERNDLTDQKALSCLAKNMELSTASNSQISSSAVSTPGSTPPPTDPKDTPRLKKVSREFFTFRTISVMSVVALAIGAVAVCYYRPHAFASWENRIIGWISARLHIQL